MNHCKGSGARRSRGRGGCREYGEQAGELIVDAGIDKLEAALRIRIASLVSSIRRAWRLAS